MKTHIRHTISDLAVFSALVLWCLIGLRSALLAQDLIGEAGLVEPKGAGGRGPRGSRGPNKWLDQIMGSLGNSIAGGASNIQRNIIGERGLGLPRDLALSGEK
jgi:hypothetical protein